MDTPIRSISILGARFEMRPGTLIACIAICAIAGIFAGLALSGSDFEGSDGDLAAAIGSDWDTMMASTSFHVGYDAPSGQNDDALSGKEDYDPIDVIYGSIPKNKSDLLRFYVAHERTGLTDAERDFLHVAWVRGNTLGSANMDFEFNQSDVLSANGMTPIRTAGDLLVMFGFGSGGNVVDLSMSRWTEAGPCEASSSGPCWGPAEPLSGIAEGAINDVDVFDPVENVTLAAQTFGEASIDLTAAGVFDAESCTSFGSAFVKSRSSDSFTSSMKDFIQPVDVSISNCATIKIVKDAVPNDEQTFDFEASPELNGGSFTLQDDGDDSDGQPSSITINEKIEGTVFVRELAAEGWDLTDVVCTEGADVAKSADGSPSKEISIDAAPGVMVECVFTNTKRGSIRVDVVTDPAGDPATFDFTIDGSGDAFDSAFQLADGSALHDSGALPTGVYSVAQADGGEAWDLTSASCDDGSDPSAVQLDPGEVVTCTFVNTKRGRILVDVESVPADDPQAFDLALDGGPSALADAFSLAHGDPAHDSGYVLPGSGYAASQNLPDGWYLQSASCDDGSSVGDVQVSPGEVVRCTFRNGRMARVLVSKETVPGGMSDSFDFDLSGGPSDANQLFALSHGAKAHDSGFLLPGSGYAVEELALPSDGGIDWDLTDITCYSANGGSAISYGGSGADVAAFDSGDSYASIDLGVADEVSCTFVNTKRSEIAVAVNAIPDGVKDFDYELSGPDSLESFGLDDDGDESDAPASGLLPSERTYDSLVQGAYLVTQLDPGAEWDLTSIECTDDRGRTVGSADVSAGQVSLELPPGRKITCLFTNVQRGRVITQKSIVNDYQSCDGLDPWQILFDYSGSDGSSFSIRHGETSQSGLLPGYSTHGVTENPPDDWAVSSSCTYPDGSMTSGGSTVSVEVPPGGEVLCTFYNELSLYPGSSGFWKNWRNHYDQWLFERMAQDALDESTVYVGLYDAGVLRDGAVDVIDAIYDYSDGATSNDDKAIRELTSAMFNLEVSKSQDDWVGQMQINDDICLDCIVDLSGIAGAEELIDAWSPTLVVGTYTVRHVIDTAHAVWTGDLSIPVWSFDLLEESEKFTLAAMLEGLNPGTIVEVDPCSYGTGLTCLVEGGLAPATMFAPYTATIEAAGGREPYTWSVADGRLPEGLYLDPYSGELSGSPIEHGTHDFTVRIEDSSSPYKSLERQYSIHVNHEPTVLALAMPEATMGEYYAEQLVVSGGTPAISFAVVEGALPPGLSLNPTTGLLSGTPTESKPAKVESYSFRIEATDVNSAWDDEQFSLTINPPDKSTTCVASDAPVGTPWLDVDLAGSHAVLEWSALDGAEAYDVVGGDLVALRQSFGDFASHSEHCFADDRTTTSVAVTMKPESGGAIWFSVRGVSCGGNGTFDSESSRQIAPRDPGIAASGAACP